jgi:hypothetical protein
METHDLMGAILGRADGVLMSLKTYEGCQAYVQKAISSPTEENLNAAWEALKPAIGKLKSFYDYGSELENAFPTFLAQLVGTPGKAAHLKLQEQQALAKQLAALLDFVIRFDHIKMNTPSIQNDFSYFRRSMARMKRDGMELHDGSTVSDEAANRMSLFYASHTPIMSILVQAAQKFIADKRSNVDSVCSALSVMAGSCRDMLRNKQFSQESTNLFCLRSMCSSIILFDILDGQGAFHKKSPINVKSCVLVLKDWPDKVERLSLCNMVRFTTRHLKDDNTVAGTSELLDEVARESEPDGGMQNNNNNN